MSHDESKVNKPILVFSNSGITLEVSELVPEPVSECLLALGGPLRETPDCPREVVSRLSIHSRNVADYLCKTVPYTTFEKRLGHMYVYVPLEYLVVVCKSNRLRKEVA